MIFVKKSASIFLFLSFFVLFALWQAPIAKIVQILIEHNNTPFSVASVSGSANSLTLHQLRLNNSSIKIPSVTIKPIWLKLFTGNLAANVSAEILGGAFNFDLSSGIIPSNIDIKGSFDDINLAKIPFPAKFVGYKYAENFSGLVSGTSEAKIFTNKEDVLKNHLFVSLQGQKLHGALKDSGAILQLADLTGSVNVYGNSLSVDISSIPKDTEIGLNVTLDSPLNIESIGMSPVKGEAVIQIQKTTIRSPLDGSLAKLSIGS